MESEPEENYKAKYLALKEEFEEFTYIVSHDLRAPLRAISNLSGWISEDLADAPDQEVKRNLTLLQNRVQRLDEMINALMELSRVDRQNLKVEFVPVHDLVLQLIEPWKSSSKVMVHLENLPEFRTYAKKLETVFFHLLQNALQFNHSPQPMVWIKARQMGNWFEFSIKDNGMGISEEAQKKIFTLFYSVQPKDKSTGSGAGLTLARKIIQFVEGQLNVTSTVGEGSEFTFTWPAAPLIKMSF